MRANIVRKKSSICYLIILIQEIITQKMLHPVKNMERQLVLIFVSCALLVGATFNPRFVEPINNVTVDVGKDATFTCVVSQIQGYRVGWVKANTKAIQAIGTHVITHNPRISVSHDESRRRWMLHITRAELEDTGPYMCQLNTDPMKSQMGFLEVVIPPDIVDIRGEMTVVEGGNVRMECEARGEPKPHVFWQRENHRDTITVYEKGTNRRVSKERVNGPVLELRKVSRSQMGGYLCIASNGHPPAVSRRVQIDVKFGPVVKIPIQKITGYEGDSVKLECLKEAFPRGDHHWEKGTNREMLNGNLANNANFKTEDFLLNVYTTRSVLSIANFTKEEVGIYKCVAKNNMIENDDRVEGIIYLDMAHGPETTPEYYTEYEISLIPTGDENVVYYDRSAVTRPPPGWSYSPRHQVTRRTGPRKHSTESHVSQRQGSNSRVEHTGDDRNLLGVAVSINGIYTRVPLLTLCITFITYLRC